LPTDRVVHQDDDDYATALAQAYGHGAAVCLCRSRADQRKLKICRREGDAGKVTYYVARFIHTGEEHADRCSHAHLNPLRSGARVYDDGVVAESDDDGTLTLRFSLPLSTRELAVVTPASLHADRDATPARLPSASPLGLLHLLWESAGFTTWYPYYGKGRFSKMLSSRLQDAAVRIRLGRIDLTSVFYPILVPERDGSRDDLHGLLGHARRERRRAILVGEVAYADSGEPFVIGATRSYGISIKLDASRLAERFPHVRPIVAQQGRGVVLALVEMTDTRTPAGNLILSVVDAAVMGVERMTWIPVDSTYELLVAGMLVREERSFRKPMRYDAHRDVALADFELLDVGERVVPMEVFGRDDATYLARAARKHALYDELYGPLWWSWDAATNSKPPLLPRAR